MSSGLQTLNEMTQLRETGFGMPWPRHGLKLLYWFSTRCISFDGNNEMVSRCDPRRGHFGFHRFINRPIEEGVTLLPVEELQYYVLGNVNFPKADQLPEYVRKNRALKGSNKDRIIISLDAQKIRKVYITTHIDNKEFDINNTFLISRDLLTNISLHQDSTRHASMQDHQPSQNPCVKCCSRWRYCIALFIPIIVLFVIVFLLIKYLK
uniref:Wu:fc75a09 n=1 Tax=Astyanax mexicanus TaxID=7994 RepID=A0A8B9LRG5_ASTMX